MDINGKNIILTGASSGIGLEMLKILAGYDNVKIVAVARHTGAIPQMAGIIFPYVADVSTQDGVDKLFSFAQDTFGLVDIFIANAGFAYLEKIENPDWNHIEQIFKLNMFSPIYSLEKLIGRSDNNTKRAFVCTISGAGLVSLPGYSLYCSTKAALHHFISTYRYEKPSCLQITTVYPVATETSFFDKASKEENTPLPWPRQGACTVARKIIKGIEKNKKRVFPSLLFRLFYPIGRAFPYLLKLYSLSEKRKIKKWL